MENTCQVCKKLTCSSHARGLGYHLETALLAFMSVHVIFVQITSNEVFLIYTFIRSLKPGTVDSSVGCDLYLFDINVKQIEFILKFYVFDTDDEEEFVSYR